MAERDHTPEEQFDESQSDIALTLTGTLPCVGCGYELQGLSVLGACPECGAAIRATILHVVDPLADELRPLIHPRLVAVALPLWATAALIAAVAAWFPRFDGLVRHLSDGRRSLDVELAPWLALSFTFLSAIGAFGIAHLLCNAHRKWTIMATIGVVLYAPLLFVMWRLYFVIDPNSLEPYFSSVVSADRLLYRIVAMTLIALILLGLRPNARLLVARSLALRSGRVDRQTIYAMVASIVLAAMGDVIRLLAMAGPPTYEPAIDTAGAMIVLCGSMLFTLGLVGSTIDTWRIRRAILTPSPSLKRLLARGV